VPFFWFTVVMLALLAYVILDGYDLGIGVLTLAGRDPARNRIMLEVVGNVWDGNESWLILLAMGLWAGMPEAYATALPGLYLPLCVMLIALIFRGFAVEMTLHRPGFDCLWGRLFGLGSLIAAFAQGLLFGGLLSGVTVVGGRFAGGAWDFLGHGYGLVTGCAVVLLHTWAGAAQLQAKMSGAARRRMAVTTRRLTLAVVGVSLLCAGLLPVATSAHLRLDGVGRWLPFAYALLVAIGGFVTVYRRSGKSPHHVPFFAVAAAEAAGLVALVVLYYPQLVPPSVTLYSAAASPATLKFLIVVIAVLGPVTVAYSIYSHWVFRGVQRSGPARPGHPGTAPVPELDGSH
jgi:cytochrome d ubiquinol oxidase subunit II